VNYDIISFPADRRFPCAVVKRKGFDLQLRMSYSAVSAYEKCPLSYRFQYIDGLEVKPSPYLSYGRSLHDALEWLYGRDVPEPPPLDELISYLDSCWCSEGYADSDEEESYLRHARDVLAQFYHKNIEDFRLPLAVEERFEIDMDDFVLSGVIDRVDRHLDGSYEIIDYKTNRRLPDLRRLREDLQLPIYQLACAEVWGISPSKLTFYYLVPNQRYSTKPRDQQGLQRVRERLKRVAESISEGAFPATPNRLCPWCSFEDVCPQRIATDDLHESYQTRHSALIRRRDKLEKAISELESEMREKGVELDDS
jgi:RecB family exonuclease